MKRKNKNFIIYSLMAILIALCISLTNTSTYSNELNTEELEWNVKIINEYDVINNGIDVKNNIEKPLITNNSIEINNIKVLKNDNIIYKFTIRNNGIYNAKINYLNGGKLVDSTNVVNRIYNCSTDKLIEINDIIQKQSDLNLCISLSSDHDDIVSLTKLLIKFVQT